MKKMGNAKKILIIIMLFISILLFKEIYLNREKSFTVSFDSMDKGIDYQIFYTTEDEPTFNEINTLMYKTIGNNSEFEHYEIKFITDKNLKDFRIDFGSNPETLKIKNLTLTGDVETVISLEELIAGFNTDIDSYELKYDYLQINSYKADPSSTILDVNALPMEEITVSYSDLVDLCIIYFMVLGFGRYLYKKHAYKNIKK